MTTSPPASDAPAPVDSADTAMSCEHGRLGSTVIADLVVAKIASLAAREVGGVFGLGSNAARVVGVLRDRMPGTRVDDTQGVVVEVGARQAAIDLTLVAEYGVAIHELVGAVRENVVSAVEGMTGLEVTEVNIAVGDVRVPGDPRGADVDPEPAERATEPRPRVR